MSQFEKFKARILQDKVPVNVMPEELQKFMLNYGFELKSKVGSHFTYKHHKIAYCVTIPMHKPIKFVYIKLVKKAIKDLEGI